MPSQSFSGTAAGADGSTGAFLAQQSLGAAATAGFPGSGTIHLGPSRSRPTSAAGGSTSPALHQSSVQRRVQYQYQYQYHPANPQPIYDDGEEDRRSVLSVTSTIASTAATATSTIVNRLQQLNLDFFQDKLQEGIVTYEDSILEGNESTSVDDDASVDGDHGVEPPGVGPHEHMEDGDSPSHHLPPFTVSSRLFLSRRSGAVQLKRINMTQVDELRHHGYAVVDGFVSRELAGQVRAWVGAQHKKGRMQEAAGRGTSTSTECPVTTSSPASASAAAAASADRPLVRGDSVLWLLGPAARPAGAGAGAGAAAGDAGSQPAQPPVLSTLLSAFQELYDDLQEVVRLRRPPGEFQLSFHPAGSVGCSRHRDALPDGARGAGLGHSSSSIGATAATSGSSTPVAGSSGQRPASAGGNSCAVAAAAAAAAGALDASSSGQGGQHLAHQQQHQQHQHQHQAAAQQGASNQGGGAPLVHRRSSSGVSISGAAGTSAAAAAAAAGAASAAGQRRVTCVLCCGSGSGSGEWQREHGGAVRVWPPRRSIGAAHLGAAAAASIAAAAAASGPPSAAGMLASGGGGAGAGGHSRRSLTGSDAGASAISEDRSDTFSIRSHYVGAPSVTSSVWADFNRAEAVEDNASIDNLSVAELMEQKEERVGLEWCELEGELALDVAPLPGRLLLLLSGTVEHAVTPCSADMVVATAWFQ